jgi:hypothetical protein
MRGVGDLLLAIGLILVSAGVMGSLDGRLHRILPVGAACVVIALWVRRHHPRDGVPR